ncbi:tyrosine-type recombinase/integrase [Oceanotoga teriensis]|uniref:tyrosine-type recombinase/integrase n=1 Tax=Oceanotoga teriensis TaxID=515440 RepID=UPI0027122B77|nr:tyrosine-type recombinase/integrase [Oceanotoga teriensis]MDO7976747.1 tyrosine-type recombinase/integrase [Oceanotoga teriensis]
MNRKIPIILNEEEQTRLINVFNERYPSSFRNKVMVRFMLDTGLRLSEAINLKWKHVDLMSGILNVFEGKGKKDRNLYVRDESIELLQKWKKRQADVLKNKEINIKPEYVFTTLKGNKISSRYVREMIYKYTDKAGIHKERKISPHTLRHTFATDLYKKTKDIRKVQKALGHSDLSTTMIYTHIADSDLEDAMKSFRDD